MPPKPLSKKRLTSLRRRFRDLIDWAFDGNLSLASRVLGMPFSTVQQYYQQGPRRMSAKTLSAIDRITGLADWLAGVARSDFTGKFPNTIAEAQPWRTLRAAKEGPGFMVPDCVLWRVEHVADAIIQLNPELERKAAQLIVVGSILDALKNGLIRAPRENIRLPATVGGELHPDVKDLAGSLGMGREAAHHVHAACAWWERFLGIE